MSGADIMRFQFPHTDLTFDIPGDWWRFAEMEGFTPRYPNCYTWPTEAATDRIDFSIVPISAIEPPTQRIATKSELAKARIVPILLAISSGNHCHRCSWKRSGTTDTYWSLAFTATARPSRPASKRSLPCSTK